MIQTNQLLTLVLGSVTLPNSFNKSALQKPTCFSVQKSKSSRKSNSNLSIRILQFLVDLLHDGVVRAHEFEWFGHRGHRRRRRANHRPQALQRRLVQRGVRFLEISYF